MALFSPPLLTHLLQPSLLSKPHFTHKATVSLRPTKSFLFLCAPKSSTDNGAGVSAPAAATVEESKVEEHKPSGSAAVVAEESSLGNNGAVAEEQEVKVESKFVAPRWIGGTWDLKQFQKDGKTDWDAVIDAAPATATVEEAQLEEQKPSGSAPVVAEESCLGDNGAVAEEKEVKVESKFVDPRWIGGTWDFKQFQKDGKTDWDAVIDAVEAALLFEKENCCMQINHSRISHSFFVL